MIKSSKMRWRGGDMWYEGGEKEGIYEDQAVSG
jgi:hypothetical protein